MKALKYVGQARRYYRGQDPITKEIVSVIQGGTVFVSDEYAKDLLKSFPDEFETSHKKVPSELEQKESIARHNSKEEKRQRDDYIKQLRGRIENLEADIRKHKASEKDWKEKVAGLEERIDFILKEKHQIKNELLQMEEQYAYYRKQVKADTVKKLQKQVSDLSDECALLKRQAAKGNYNAMTREEIKAECDRKGIAYPSNATKANLIEKLKEK